MRAGLIGAGLLGAGLFGLGVTSSACRVESSELPRVSVAADLTLPKGVLNRATKLTLTVLEGSVTCDATVGQTSLPQGVEGAREVARRDLGTAGCATGVRFCGDLNVEKSDAMRVFSAVAKGDGDATLAIGCLEAKIEQDAVPIAIKMFRYLAPANCSDTIVQPTEQCSSPDTAICDAECQTKEVLLSVGSNQNGTLTGVAGDKTDPYLLWPPQTGPQGRFFAFYTDRSQTDPVNVEVALRAMTDDLSPIGAGDSPALSAGSIFLPNGPTFPAPPAPRRQAIPQAAFLGGKYYVVFEDDDTPTPNGLDIHLRSMDDRLVAEQGASPLGINGGQAGTGGDSGKGEPAIQSAPAIAAGPQNRLFIAWQDEGQGKIAGRTLSPPGTLGSQNDLSTGTGNKGVSIAPTATGWVAAWQSGTGIKLRIVNEDGTPQGSEQTVNDGGTVTERPRVASLADGRFAVTWSSGGDVFVQRYDAKGTKIAGDQAAPVNDVVKAGDQITPSIAGSAAANGAYVVAWLDVGSGNVNARMLGGTAGFLFNNVNGQSTEFQASRSLNRVRANPVVAVGGAGPHVAIGWEDQTAAAGAGIVVRRFPLPTE